MNLCYLDFNQVKEDMLDGFEVSSLGRQFQLYNPLNVWRNRRNNLKIVFASFPCWLQKWPAELHGTSTLITSTFNWALNNWRTFVFIFKSINSSDWIADHCDPHRVERDLRARLALAHKFWSKSLARVHKKHSLCLYLL